MSNDPTLARPSDVAELSTLGSQLDDIARRVEALAGRYRNTPDSAVAASLDAAERSIVAVRRSLTRAADDLGPGST